MDEDNLPDDVDVSSGEKYEPGREDYEEYEEPILPSCAARFFCFLFISTRKENKEEA